VKALVIALLVTLGACKFDQGSFGDRTCTIDQDCGRPDLACIENACAPRACTVAADCGPDFLYACTDLGCVAQGCSGSDECGVGYACNAGLCQASFNVIGAQAASNTSVDVTFDAPPEMAAAVDPDSYVVSGLSIVGTPVLSGSTVTLTTSPQTATSYTVTVTGVTRASDHIALGAATATFDGRTAFDVTGATSSSVHTVVVTFDAEPEATSAATLANYSIAGLTLSGTPDVSGNTVTLMTSQQAAQAYTVMVSGVRRASDGEALTQASATFGGRNAFDVATAAPHTSSAVDVTFDAAPNPAQATNLASYSIPGLVLSGAPVLTGSTVRLTTSPQTASSYMVMVSGVTRASDGEPLTVATAGFTGIPAFDVASATATTSHSVRVTFDGPPDPVLAVDPANYDIQGLTIGGTPVLAGNSVTLQTSPQTAGSYTVTVSNVTRTDGEPLTGSSAQFMGRAPFDVDGAVSATSQRVILSFDGPPNVGQAQNPANYSIPGLTISGTPVVSGNSVTLSTSPQSNASYTVTVSNVTRSGDGEALTVATAMFDGRAPFDVAGAAATSNTSLVVTFDAPPDAGEATTPGNYNVPGLTLTGVPSLSGNQVMLATSPQSSGTYAVLVSGVTRASDGEALTVANASFAGRPAFDVAGAASASNVSMTVTFDAPPNEAQAEDASHYNIPGLALAGTPVLSGNTVTIPTAPQAVQSYTVTVSGVTRASDGEALTVASASFTGRTGFNVSSAASVNTTTMSVTFDAPPNAAQATTLASYSVPGLALSGTPVLSGNTVTITTAAQAAQTYTVTVTGVTRQSDGSPLAVNTASFTHVAFDVAGAASVTSHTMSVTFDAPPDPTQATTLANYSVVGLTLSGTPVLAGNTVTIATGSQSATTYTVNVSNVTRASDGTVLTNRAASFTGRSPFDVTGAASTSSGSLTVTFSAPPNSAQATTLANYSVPGLTLGGTPLLSGNTVTLKTSAQAAQSYTVTVSNVTRASDAEALGVNNASFAGTPLQVPTVTNVVVMSTAPDNGTRYYNTGTATVVITGTDFTGVACPSGVKLNDTNGAGTVIGTHPTSCTVDSGTQITATFPAGVLTHGTLGWDVLVTNAVGTNTASTVNLIPYAGILVSEVMQGRQAAGQHEFIELYNPTQNAIDAGTLHVHIRTGSDQNLALTYASTMIPPHGFFLITSTQSSPETWYGSRDATYDASAGELAGNSGMYISLSAIAQARVLDKLGWGNVQQPWNEGHATNNLGNDTSVQRLPAGGAGAATDTDNNKNDFNSPSSGITPLGSSAPPQP
jgi:predicted RNA-binding protein with TRAM domain